MKKNLLFFSLLVSLLSVLSPMPAQAQQENAHKLTTSQRGVITWQKNGGVNAMLYDDLDSITFSRVGLDGKTYPNVVVQEIWKQDSVYRIPIAEIDSVAFKAPNTVYNNNVFHIKDFHYPYVTEVTDLTVTFDAAIPTDSLPHVGQVVISDKAYEAPFIHGFSGRVISVENLDGSILIVCEEVALEDIFDQLFCFGKVITTSEDSTSLQTQNRAIDIVDQEGYKTIPFGKKTINIINDGDNKISLDITPHITIDYLVYIGIGAKDRFKFVFNNIFECDFDFKTERSFNANKTQYLLVEPLSITILPQIGLNAFFNLGGYVHLNGNAELGVKRRVTLNSQIGYDSDCQGNDADHKGLWLKFNEPDWGHTNGYANFNSKISAGVALKTGVCIADEDLANFNLELKVGPRISGHLGFSTDNDTFYDEHLNDTISFEPLRATLAASVNVLGHQKSWPLADLPISSWFPGLAPRTLYLFPRFTDPQLPSLSSSGYSLTALTTDISRNLIFPITPGISITNSDNNEYTCFSNAQYRTANSWDGTNLQMELNQYPVGTYTAKPVFKIFNKAVNAAPVSTVTIPEPLSVTSSATVKIGETTTIPFSGGWGGYSLTNSNSDLCSAYITGNNINISGLKEGTASLRLRDERSSESKNIKVTVEDGTPKIVVTPESHDFGTLGLGGLTRKQTFTVTATNSTGSLILTSSEDIGGHFTISSRLSNSGGTVIVTYNPTDVGNHSGWFTVSSNNAVSPRVNYEGRCVSITTNKNTVDCGTVNLNNSNKTSTGTFTVTGKNLRGNLTLSSSNPFFKLNQTSIANPNGTTTVTVTYQPTERGSHTGTISIAGDGVTKTITVTGTCIKPEITASSNPADIGNVEVGASGFVDITVTGTDLQNNNITMDTPHYETVGGEFTISKTALPATGGTVRVTYKPSGTHSSTARFTFKSGNESVTITVKGKGIGTITPNPTSLAFGNVPKGYPAEKTFTVTGSNLSGNLTLSSSNSHFSVSPTTITSPNGTTTVKVTYDASALNSHTGTITISGGEANSKTVSLSATCVQPSLTASPNPANIGDVVIGNTGTATITITGVNLPKAITLDSNWGESIGGEFSITRASHTTNGATVTDKYTVTYRPSGVHDSSAWFTFKSGNESVTVKVNGKGKTVITTTHSTLNFSAAGEEVQQTVRCQYANSDLTLTKSGDYTYFTGIPSSISQSQAKAGLTFTVTAKPSLANVNSASATVTISGGGADNKTFYISYKKGQPVAITSIKPDDETDEVTEGD